MISIRKSVYNIELSLPTTVRRDPRVSNAPASFSAFERRRDLLRRWRTTEVARLDTRSTRSLSADRARVLTTV
jgi:hypothetical protein